MDQKKLIQQVKELREELGLGIMDIKAALEQTDGDVAKTKELLKEKTKAAAAKRADKETHQGLVATYTHFTGKMAAMVQILCETDFVAKGDKFIQLSKDICSQVAATNPETVEKLMEEDFVKDPTRKVKDLVSELSGTVGENIKIGKFARLEI